MVLSTRAEPWLTQTLKRVNRQKRPLNSVSQHKKCLEDILAGTEATWLLASMILPTKATADFDKRDDKMVETMVNYDILDIMGYVVHVDMVSQHEVAFKLTQDSIDNLIHYHTHVYSKNAAASYEYDWPEKPRQIQKLHDDFVQAINRYVFRTGSRALEGLEDEGTGELLEGRSWDIKNAIDDLFKPLLPPPPKIIDVIGPPSGWWHSQYVVGGYQYQTQYAQQYAPQYQQQQQQQPPPQQSQYLQRPVEPWRVLGSSPSPSPSYASDIQSTPWPQPSQPRQQSQPAQHQHQYETHLPSPTPSYTQPYTCSDQYQSQPAFAPVQPLPLPSQLISSQCGTSAASGFSSFYGYNDMPLTPQGMTPQAAF